MLIFFTKLKDLVRCFVLEQRSIFKILAISIANISLELNEPIEERCTKIRIAINRQIFGQLQEPHFRIDQKLVLLPSLQIKFELRKQLVKALNKQSDCFKYLWDKFPAISEAKLKERIFVGPQTRTLKSDRLFQNMMTQDESKARSSFVEVIDGFL